LQSIWGTHLKIHLPWGTYLI